MGCEFICKKGEDENELLVKEQDEPEEIEDDKKTIDNYPEEVKDEEDDSDYMNRLRSRPPNDSEKKESENSKSKTYGYNERALRTINNIRKCPKKYSYTIKENKQFIIEENHKEVNKDTFVEEEKTNIVYKNKVKVLLHEGKKKFDETAELLKKTEPINPLEFKKEILIPLPNEDEINDKTFIRNQVNEIRKSHNINVYYKDNIKNPEVGILLMMVDDNNGPSVGKKRSAILNPDFKYVAINSGFVGTKFVAFYSFSK